MAEKITSDEKVPWPNAKDDYELKDVIGKIYYANAYLFLRNELIFLALLPQAL